MSTFRVPFPSLSIAYFFFLILSHYLLSITENLKATTNAADDDDNNNNNGDKEEGREWKRIEIIIICPLRAKMAMNRNEYKEENEENFTLNDLPSNLLCLHIER